MGVFERFQELATRFTSAGEINGCVWEWLLSYLSRDEPVKPRSAEPILGYLRELISKPDSDEVSLPNGLEECLKATEGSRTASRRGRPFTWLECPVTRKGGDGTCGEASFDRNTRNQFRNGDLARFQLLEMIGIDDLAAAQVHNVGRVWGTCWSKDMILQLAEDAVRHRRFEDGCYAKATFAFLQKQASLLEETRSCGTRITIKAVRGVVRTRCRTSDGMTLYGRFGSIIRESLEAMVGEKALPLPPSLPQAQQAEETWILRNDLAIALDRSSEQDRPIVAAVMRYIDEGHGRQDAIRFAGSTLSVSYETVREAFRRYQDGLSEDMQ